MILEINPEAIRDIAAAVHAARRREPDIEILAVVEKKVLDAIQDKSHTLELDDQEAQSLRNVLMQRAYDQRRTQEAADYEELADRILRDLDSEVSPLFENTE
jgi:hypothetical protein